MSDPFERWLRTVCFQKPTQEAYDLARDAWQAAIKQERETLEKPILWCMRNLDQRAHYEMLSDPSNGVMRAFEAIRARSAVADTSVER